MTEKVPARTIQSHVKDLLIKIFSGDLESLKKSGTEKDYGERSIALRVLRPEDRS